MLLLTIVAVQLAIIGVGAAVNAASWAVLTSLAVVLAVSLAMGRSLRAGRRHELG